MVGARSAVDLITQERTRLGVHPDDVIAVGTSFGAVTGLYIGLRAAVGRILAGGAPIDMGRQLQRLSKIDGVKNPAKAAAPEFLALARGGPGGVKPVDFFNNILYVAASETIAAVKIDLFVSEQDRSHKAMRKFWKELQTHPTITCEFHTSEYGPHNNIREAFFGWAGEQIASHKTAV